MELVTKKRLVLVAGRANHELAEEVAESLGTPLDPVEISEFANGSCTAVSAIPSAARTCSSSVVTAPPDRCRSTTRSWSS
ncbi:MAG: ribose-phosphate pyrophosphokinase-like domain-containing protein [Microthrixaceae bacterium]